MNRIDVYCDPASLLSRIRLNSDRGVQYRAVRYTDRLAEAEAVASVGSKGDSYDNAMAEALNSLFKAELIRNRGPWKGIDDLEIAVAEYIDWYNHRRLHGEIEYSRSWGPLLLPSGASDAING
ncbi:transposase InsO family protein [Leifsonia psychrotolerans]|uniref:Transposase InsO family protein n=1 Tax=Glaciibacter psychrotolerans TaxID=670054 RepID=A0A7Z0J5W0_9MICO|nr:transposase InsO family protein [Leifsonia psychrotolerans]